jgi:hypothetical protein
VIFVPYSTDERKAFDRIRYTAQARAVENFVYTVIAGNVGNLPAAKNYLINYGQAAVFTPQRLCLSAVRHGRHQRGQRGRRCSSPTWISPLWCSSVTWPQCAIFTYRRSDLYDVRAKRAVKSGHGVACLLTGRVQDLRAAASMGRSTIRPSNVEARRLAACSGRRRDEPLGVFEFGGCRGEGLVDDCGVDLGWMAGFAGVAQLRAKRLSASSPAAS